MPGSRLLPLIEDHISLSGADVVDATALRRFRIIAKIALCISSAYISCVVSGVRRGRVVASVLDDSTEIIVRRPSNGRKNGFEVDSCLKLDSSALLAIPSKS